MKGYFSANLLLKYLLKKLPNCLGWGYKIKYQISLKSLKFFSVHKSSQLSY